VFVLDEYCARYGVRGCHRHLSYLTDLLDFAELATMIDPTLIHYSFAFCASHTHGNRSGPPHVCLLFYTSIRSRKNDRYSNNNDNYYYYYTKPTKWLGGVVVRASCEFDSRPCTAGLILGWVTVCGRVNHLGMEPVT